MARAFIIRPFGTKKDSGGAEVDFERVDRELIRPALEAVDSAEVPRARSWMPGISARTCSG